MKNKFKKRFEIIAIEFLRVMGNIFVFAFFASLWMAFTYHYQVELTKLPSFFIVSYLIGGFIVLVNTFRINWMRIFKQNEN